MTSPNESLPYRTPRAFEAALASRFKAMAAGAPYTATQLRRQFAYDRLLARCFSGPEARMWVLKGGISMLARLEVARHSSDIDLVAKAESPLDALAILTKTIQVDLGDFFTFTLDEPQLLVQGVEGVRVPVAARLGPRPFDRFHLDLVTAVTMTGEPELVPSIADPGIPGLVRVDYRVYPLVDTIADKLCAIMEWHGTRPSTRFRDLVDLVLIVRSRPFSARELRIAVASERRRRALSTGGAFDVPDREMWRSGYATAAERAPGLDGYRDLSSALELVRRCVTPIMDGALTSGMWDPGAQRWFD